MLRTKIGINFQQLQLLDVAYEDGPNHLSCNHGPYIWDKSKHEGSLAEGIGSTFQFRKPSLIAKHFFNDSWIGRLTNAHYPMAGDQSSYFGLSYSHCNFESLEYHENEDKLEFIYVPKESINSYIINGSLSQITNIRIIHI